MTHVEPQPSRLGHFAGPVTRALAYGIDVALSALLFAVAWAVADYLLDLIFHVRIQADDVPTWVSATIYAGWLWCYFGGTWAAGGKTPGMALLGLRVVNRDGTPLAPWRGIVRAPALALSLMTFGIGLIGIVIGREHRALQDVLAGSVVVYDWDARVARLRFLARRAT